MRVGITGSTGFIGCNLIKALARRGDSVVALTRRPSAAAAADGVTVAAFDVGAPRAEHLSTIEELDVVVHLAGEPVDGRWTPQKKHAIFSSRVDGTRHLVEALQRVRRRPRALVCASATGYYGNRGDERLDETAEPGFDFLAQVCIGWEREASAARDLGMRVVSLRTGIVLGAGGALRRLLPIFRCGIGGPIASGKQWMPWIHIDDIVALYLFAIDDADTSGAYNAVAPDAATNSRFTKALGRALRRPTIVPVPAFGLRLLFGEFAETLVGGQLVVPAKARAAGFVWSYPSLEEAVRVAVAPKALRGAKAV